MIPFDVDNPISCHLTSGVNAYNNHGIMILPGSAVWCQVSVDERLHLRLIDVEVGVHIPHILKIFQSVH